MKFLGVAIGLLVSSACSGLPIDSDEEATTEAESGVTSSLDAFRGGGHPGDRNHGHCSSGIRKAVRAAAGRLAALQADTIGDNARNGLDDTDPDDGGWDFIIAPSATQHTAAASPTNLFGAIGLAAWIAVDSGIAGNRALVTALDAGAGMQRNPDVDSGPDFVFGPLLAELADNPGFAEVARQHYDAKRAAAGGAVGFGTLIRDGRHARNEDGLIPYDLGWLALGAGALDAAFPGAGYDQDADVYAGLVVDDLTAATPLFDIKDPTEGFYITGLAWAQIASSRLHASALFRRVRARLLDEQHGNGAWGTNATRPADDLQATAHALQTLGLTDRSTQPSRRAVRRATRFLLDAQAASGGWPDAANLELPLVDADIVLGLMLSRTHSDEDLTPEPAPAATALAPSSAGPRAAPMP